MIHDPCRGLGSNTAHFLVCVDYLNRHSSIQIVAASDVGVVQVLWDN
jgi:hypothetical protein